MRASRFFALAGLAAGLVGCTGLSSVPVGSPEDRNTGVIYFLPTTRIPLSVRINESERQLILRADMPVYMADETARYRLRGNANPFYVEAYDLTVNSAGLLTKADIKSEGRLDEIITAAAKSAFILQSAVAGAEELIIFETPIDVGALAGDSGTPKTQALKDLQDRINLAIAAYVARSGTDGSNSGKKSFLASYPISDPYIELNVSRYFSQAAAATGPAEPPDCSVGICYRLPVAYVLKAEFGDETVRETAFQVPNGSATYVAAMPRGLFTTIQTIGTMENGMLTGYKRTETGSELEALVSIPANIVGAQLEALTQQGKVFGARGDVAKEQIELIKAERELAELRQQNAPTRRDALFEFAVGESTAAESAGSGDPEPSDAGPGAPDGPVSPP